MEAREGGYEHVMVGRRSVLAAVGGATTAAGCAGVAWVWGPQASVALSDEQQLVGSPVRLFRLCPVTWCPPHMSPSIVLWPNPCATVCACAQVSDVWREVTRQFIDGDYGGQGEEAWKKRRQDAVRVLSDHPGDKPRAYREIRSMLESLGDPYTRFLTPDQYEALATLARGDTAGVGVQLQLEPASGEIVVLSTVTGVCAAPSTTKTPFPSLPFLLPHLFVPVTL